MQRYFAKTINNDNIELLDTDIHHIKNVMRMNIGSNIEVVYNQRLYLCKIASITPLKLSIDNIIDNQIDDCEIILAVSLVKEQKMDLILQKATELGVSKIIPLDTERSIVKITNERFLKKKVRWTSICKEASEQSHRITIPLITEIKKIKELNEYDDYIKLACLVTEENKGLKDYEEKIKDKRKIIVVIGPEGGISKSEEETLLKLGFMPVTLGKRVLRVETAVFSSLSILTYIMG